MARIAIEEPCEHGEYLFCFKTVEVEQVKRARHKPPVTCPGGSHTVLTELNYGAARGALWSHGIEASDELVNAIVTAALFSSDTGEREETE
jgi:hypothetical protein